MAVVVLDEDLDEEDDERLVVDSVELEVVAKDDVVDWLLTCGLMEAV